MNITQEKLIRIVLGLIVFFIVYKLFAQESALIRILVFAGIYFPLVLIFNRFSKK